MKSNQISSNSLHPPVIAGASTGGESWGIFATMNPELLRSLSAIFTNQEDIDALQSLIDERKTHLMYRGFDREIYFGEKRETGGDKK